MKTHFKFTLLVVIVFLTLSCSKDSDLIVSDFQAWSNSLSLDEVREMYLSGDVFMTDVRFTETIHPFSFKDYILEVGDTVSPDYPLTNSQGMTFVNYKNIVIFENSWNKGYMGVYNLMTQIYVGEAYGLKMLKIFNHSHFPPNSKWPNGYYGTDNRFFVVKNNQLEIVDLESIGAWSGFVKTIKKSPKHGTIMLISYSASRYPTELSYRITLYDIFTSEHKTFKFPYEEFSVILD